MKPLHQNGVKPLERSLFLLVLTGCASLGVFHVTAQSHAAFNRIERCRSIYVRYATNQRLVDTLGTCRRSGAGDTITAASIDSAVGTNIASVFINPPGIDTNPTPPQGSGSTSGAFRWNSARQFLESRPTGNSRAELLLTLRNDSGADRNRVVLVVIR